MEFRSHKNEIEEMEKYFKNNILVSKKKAQEFLLKTGIYKLDGSLSENYK